MQRPQSIEELRSHLSELAADTHYLRAPADTIALDGNGELVLGNQQRFKIDPEFAHQIAKLTKIPPAFFLKLDPDIKAMVFNRVFRETSLHRDGVLLEVEVIGASAHRVRIPGSRHIGPAEVLDVVLDATPAEHREAMAALQVRSFRLNGQFQVALTSPAIIAEPSVGDVVEAGIDLFYTDSASRSDIELRTALFRLVCSNGATVRRFSDDRRVSSSDHDAGTRSELVARLRRAAGEIWDGMFARLEALRASAGRAVADPQAVLRQWARTLRLAERDRRELLAAFEQDEAGVDATEYALFLALSRIATHSRHAHQDPAWSRRLMSFAGESTQRAAADCRSCGRPLQGCS